MLSSKQILDAVSHEPARGGLQGRVMALRHGLRSGRNTLSAPSSHVKLLNELDAMAQSAPRLAPTYLHPGQEARANTNRDAVVKGNDGKPVGTALSPADVAWISRLPQNPEDVTYADAVTLAGLANTISSSTHASDARLVQSAWQPVKELHDQRQAQAQIDKVQSLPDPQMPMSALGALADAYANEFPQLRPEEAIARASADLNAKLEERRAAILQQAMQAHGALALSQAEQNMRTETVRYPDPVPGSFPIGGF